MEPLPTIVDQFVLMDRSFRCALRHKVLENLLPTGNRSDLGTAPTSTLNLIRRCIEEVSSFDALHVKQDVEIIVYEVR